MDGQKRFCDHLDFGDVEARGGSVTDGDDGPGVKSSGRDEIVVRRRRVFGGAERTSVDDCALKGASRTFFFHLVGGRGKDLRDAARSAPGDDVVGTAAGAKELRVGRRYIDFHAVVNGERVGGAKLI